MTGVQTCALPICKNWFNYNEIIRQVTLMIQDWVIDNPEDNRFTFVHTAIPGAENMITEYIGKTESFLRQKGYSIKEEIVRGNKSAPHLNDINIIERGADLALIFMTDGCKRTSACLNLIKEYGIPYKLIKD